jgi:hypothetical protein
LVIALRVEALPLQLGPEFLFDDLSDARVLQYRSVRKRGGGRLGDREFG